MTIATLKFVNPQARPKEAEFNVDIEAIPYIVAWYSSFHSSDPFKVYVNGTQQETYADWGLTGEIQ